MARPKNENWDLGDHWSTFRVKESDVLSDLLTSIDEDRGEFIRNSLLKYYEGKFLIECPTCEGKCTIYSGSKANPPKPSVKDKGKRESNKSKVFSFRPDAGLMADLEKMKDKGETAKMSVTVALSRDYELECPTCRGVGKIIGGPKKRKAALATFST